MTTDRPYRRAMSSAAAIEELRENRGGQFEPRVVDALIRVIGEGVMLEADYGDAVRAVLATHSPSNVPLEASV
jgi:HD-GYP domain-containing protein (c-di-GMP phosphodiesterase class II)